MRAPLSKNRLTLAVLLGLVAVAATAVIPANDTARSHAADTGTSGPKTSTGRELAGPGVHHEEYLQGSGGEFAPPPEASPADSAVKAAPRSGHRKHAGKAHARGNPGKTSTGRELTGPGAHDEEYVPPARAGSVPVDSFRTRPQRDTSEPPAPRR